MTTDLHRRDLVIGLTPFTEPNAALAVAVERAGGLGVLDLGRDAAAAREALTRVRRRWAGTFGVRVSPGCPLAPGDLPDEVDTVVVAGTDARPWAKDGRRLLAEVTSPEQARTAVERGASGVIAKGMESGGRVGELSTFVLLQRLVAELGVPVWAQGGIGVNTAAAAVAGGARGVVIDSQLALVREGGLPKATASAIAAMDGSETTVIGGHRVYTRPDLPVAALAESGAPDRFGARDLRTRLLPIGQEGAFAGSLARRHKTAGGVVQAIRAAIGDGIASAAELTPLAPGAGIARDPRGPRRPVAQGPMTRVSDQAAFAAAVAGADGLPFLALALMSGDETRRLLTETAGLLGDRPWGVGLLGFAPEEVRAAQLEAVHAVRPPYALIAGGRPAQAAVLEAAGISTFLHVPSPGLLARFVKEGARKFVFEGSECGGHIGPRASFPLWESQIGCLLDHPEVLPEVSVLFAGGVHDARSAAMVAALCAPLAGRGTATGVLMGTAYLFTEEAVGAGAILPHYQRTALACDRTASLETSPGHVTRCADTPYVTAFEETRRRLAESGSTVQETWAELERLNLGRLRIAAKGLRRTGEGLSTVGEREQRDDGMYMLGQVATIRSEITTVAALHEEVTTGATRLLASAAGERPPEEAAAGPLDIAIVGMACVYPGAGDLDAFWSNVVGGVDAVTEVPAERWDTGLYYDPEAVTQPRGRTPSRWGGFIPPVPFDALEYGIPPASLGSIEPVQLLALEVAARSLRDAGYADRAFDRERTSVIFGAEAGSGLSAAYSLRSALPAYAGEVPPGLDEHLPALTDDSFPGVLSNVIAGRIANRLDLGGSNFTVDAACASSLAALDLACKELTAGTSDMVVCGGADLHNDIQDYLLFASVHALSAKGRCATFDSAADGIALGEGVACVVLKRLADAERDGDRVYALVKSVAGSSDGRSLGLTAPRPEGQRRALERAYAASGISPADVGLVEAHGTGTVVGDRTELAALTDLFTDAGAAPGSCTIGSVKSQIGHTKCAAGLAGLIKAAYALHTGTRPGSLHIGEPNPYWSPETSPFVFGASPWETPPGRRYAGVSAFGFGGANFHAVLGGYGGADEPAHGLPDWPAELFVFRGAGEDAVRHEADRLAKLLETPLRLRDLAAEHLRGAPAGPVRAAIVAADRGDLAAGLADLRAGRAGKGVHLAPDEAATGALAFLFPGQGSQRPGMLADLFIAFPRLQRLLRLAEGRYAPVLFPPAAFSREETARQKAAITDTRMAQPALGIAGLAVAELLGSLGVRPDMAGGHSYGELVALCAAGVFGEEDLLALSETRAGAILAAAGDDPGTMAAVAASAGAVRAVLEEIGIGDEVIVANDNAPAQAVVSGPTAAVERAVAALGERRMRARAVPVACAFHSPLVAPAADTLAAALAGRDVRPPAHPVWSNGTAAPYPETPDLVRALLARQVAEPVRFVEQVEAMYAAGARVFVEAGPGRVLTGLVRKILGDRPHTVVACDVSGENGVTRLLHALAGLAVAGVPVDLDPLFDGRARPAGERPARTPGWLVDGQLVRTSAGEYVPGGLRPATEAPRVNLTPTGETMADGTQRDAAVMEFLRSTREMVAAQRDVLLGYLGTTPAPALVPVAVEPVAQVLAAAVAPEETPPPGPEATATGPEEIRAVVLATVSARTGYPPDMLGTDLDLEGDLSIDSIKRTEIIGELAERLGLGGDEADVEEAVTELARIKTIGGIADWLGGHLTGPAELAEPAEPAPQAVLAASGAPGRYVVDTVTVPAPEGEGDALAGLRVVIVDDGRGVALELSDLLERRGAEPRVVETPPEDGPAAGALVHLAALRPGARPVLPAAFAGIRGAVLGGADRLVVATTTAGNFGPGTGADPDAADVGLRGLVRAIAQEYPGAVARAVDVDPKENPRAIAEHLLRELAGGDGRTVAGYRNGTRTTLRVRRADLTGEAAPPPGLGRDSVVLLTGGARGITAGAALALARLTGCHVELTGRTPAPAGPEDPATAAAADLTALRGVLARQGAGTPAEIDAAARRILTEREIRATLEELRGLAASVRHHAADVRDAAAVRALVDDVYARHGRIDGVIHGAGVLEDRLLGDKSPESFARVYGTKVDGFRALLDAVAPADPPVRPPVGFVVAFGSVSGAFGNRGQTDYAAANDALDGLSRVWAGRLPGRVVAVDWGPWAGGGMVSPELEREYARRGVTLIDPDAGLACLLRELSCGEDAQVIYACGDLGDE
ncbi:type I polyketide synthase [Actinomadura sp. DC4]|uniref:type I polyketide synthase n=1 Tax=Actinomadura sp. DC4 TaxID=3055069 RepID=UPI0025AFBD1C|nr:type I polyketide synthase [Actinomadura sp. DC4]MDN3356375.1 SDR family NAD(P)-dependent oxidoreductase [Actinomadura sp. DC4]